MHVHNTDTEADRFGWGKHIKLKVRSLPHEQWRQAFGKETLQSDEPLPDQVSSDLPIYSS